MGPLAGIRVLDLSTVLMGPSATQALGDWGADVVKVEPPEGDLIRGIGPARHPDMGPPFMNVNRSKRGIVLDLKQAAGREVALRLARDADVLVHNVRPQAMARLGLSYDAVSAANPRIVYASLVGFASEGPYSGRPAYDDLIQGAALFPHLMARSGSAEPRYVPTAIADRFCGAMAISAILASLLERDRSGRGQAVEVPMYETMMALVLTDHLGGLSFEPPLDAGGYARQLSPDRRPYRTADGHVCALVYNDGQWRRFTDAIGRSELMADPRFATFAGRTSNVAHVHAELARIFETRTTDAWLELCEAADVPALRMHDLRSMFDDPQLEAGGFFQLREHPTEGTVRTTRVPMRWSRTPAEPVRLAPVRGQHTVEVLREAGYAPAEIDALLASGAAVQSDRVPAGGGGRAGGAA